jgi:hypothetical protein
MSIERIFLEAQVLEIRPRPFYNARHTYISVALTLRCNPKRIAEQTGTSLAVIQQNYGKYIRDDGDAPLRAYVENPKTDQNEGKPKPFRVRGLTTREHWWSQRDSNPCYRRERPVS